MLDGHADLQNITSVKLVVSPCNEGFLDREGDGMVATWLASGGTALFDFRRSTGKSVDVWNIVPEPPTVYFLDLSGMIIAWRRPHFSQCFRSRRRPAPPSRVAGRSLTAPCLELVESANSEREGKRGSTTKIR